MKKLMSILSVLILVDVGVVLAEESTITAPLGVSQDVLARQGDVVLTQAEIDAAFSKIPPDLRLLFIRDGKKVEALVRNLLSNKILADEARKAGYDKDTLEVLRLELAAESSLAKDWVDKVVSDAPEVDFEAIAREEYLLDPDVWTTPDAIDVSHILISSEGRSTAAAGAMALELWEQLEADPSLFDDMVIENSEDPSKSVNQGRFPRVNRNEMVKPFEEAAFAMKTPGQISAPVETAYGFHIIRLNQYFPGTVAPFEDIKEQAIEQARQTYLDEYAKRYLKNMLDKPIVLEDGAADAMARRYFGENLELAPNMEE